MQASLRQLFKRWGLPQRLRVDNGPPWGSAGRIPSELALWLTGLGIGMVWNHPHRPEENGKVERSHGTMKRWVEPKQCANLAVLQQRLDWANELQRNHYPYERGQPRGMAYPRLSEGGRSYCSTAEDWQLARVDALLAQGLWQRRVDGDGKLKIYSRNYYVGRAHARQAVCLRFEAASRQWQVYDAEGTCLKSMPVKAFSAEAITTLNLVKPSHRSQYQKARRAQSPRSPKG